MEDKPVAIPRTGAATVSHEMQRRLALARRGYTAVHVGNIIQKNDVCVHTMRTAQDAGELGHRVRNLGDWFRMEPASEATTVYEARPAGAIVEQAIGRLMRCRMKALSEDPHPEISERESLVEHPRAIKSRNSVQLRAGGTLGGEFVWLMMEKRGNWIEDAFPLSEIRRLRDQLNEYLEEGKVNE